MTFPSRHLQRLTDPRWIAKRTELLMVRGNACEACGTPGLEVHVHHGYYQGDRYPWEYEDESLHVLCPTCHGKAQALMVEINQLLGRLSLREYEEALRAVREIGLRVGERRGGMLVVGR